jgi:superfamily II DNA or RNA helicase
MPRPPADPPELTLDVIADSFPAGMRKGLIYFGEDRADLVAVGPREATARVRGRRPRPYETTVRWVLETAGWRLDSDCTCPMGFDCKHAVATALAWHEHLDHDDTGLATPTSPRSVRDEIRIIPPRVPTRPTQPEPARALDPMALVARTNPWRALAADPVAPVHPAGLSGSKAAAAPEHSLRYFIDIDPRTGELGVCVGWCRRLKSGGWGKPRALAIGPYANLNTLGGLERDDLRLVLMLDPNRQHYDHALTWTRPRRIDPDFVEALVGSGRCHWRDASAPVLAIGPPLPLLPEWETDGEGTQRLVARLPPGVHALRPDWAYYLAPERQQIGPLESTLAAEDRRRLATLPPIDPEHLDAALAVLAPLEARIGLTAPKAIPIAPAAPMPPKVFLRLDGHPLDDGIALPRGCFVTPAFGYAGHKIPPNHPAPALRAFDGERVEVVVRDLAAEAQALRFLREEGFAPGYFGLGIPGSHERQSRPAPLATAGQARRWIDDFAGRALAAGFELEGGPTFPPLPGEDIGVADLELVPDGEDWFEARLGLVVDDERIDLLPILLAAARDAGRLRRDGLRLTLPSGRRVRLSPERLAPMLDLLDELERRGDALVAPRSRLAGLEPAPDWRFRPDQRLEAFRERLREFAGLAPLDPPPGFGATLRPYQRQGLAWLDFLERYGFGGVLADDMGLGKTVQWLAWFACDRARRATGAPALIVCPTSVGPNWIAEIARWLPGTRATLLQRGDRSATLDDLARFDLIVTSYALLVRDIEALAAVDWRAVVFDEAQWLKNRDTKGWQAATRLRAGVRVAMSGTPVENHLGELKAAFDLVMPGLLGNERQFGQRYRQRIERSRDAEAEAALRRRIRPFLLRRTKGEVAADLPPRSLVVQRIDFDGAQRDLYETLRAQMEKRVRDALARQGLARSRITVLDALLKLRQVCCDPDLLPGTARKRKVPSAKREALIELLPTLIEDGRRILVFSQFTQMLDRIEADLGVARIAHVRLDGRTRNRAAPVERFQRGEVPVFLISLKAGGVGLNLTAADTVVLYDPWWNPAVEAQAIDRAHRIGQDKPVFVYELQCVGTVEEKMATLKARKRDLAEAVLAEGDAALSRLDADDLLDLFAPGGT